MKNAILSALAGLAMVACASDNQSAIPADALEECLYQGDRTSFSVWAPDAEAAVLRIYSKAVGGEPEMVFDMKRNRDGLWKKTVREDIKGLFYTFQLMHAGEWLPETQGIAAKAVGVNGIRGAVIDWSETDPDGWEDDKAPEI